MNDWLRFTLIAFVAITCAVIADALGGGGLLELVAIGVGATVAGIALDALLKRREARRVSG